MNKTRQLIVIAIVLISAIALMLVVFVGGGDSNKNNGSETAETEGSLPVHSILYSPAVIDINGPFTIEYLYTKDSVDYIKVTDSSPQGRMNAMHWLRERGIDPTDLGIYFDDFANPLNSEGN